MVQTLHYLKGIGELSCVETPLSRGRESVFWNIDIDIPEKGMTFQKRKIYQNQLDDIVIDILANVMDGDLSDFRLYEYWQN